MTRRAVLYLMGTGRSGSTLLDIILGSNPGVVGTGELSNLVARAWGIVNCVRCGAPATDCEYWGEVREQWRTAIGEDPSEEYVALQAIVEGVGRLPWGLGAGADAATRARWAHLTLALLDAVAQVSGAALIVDSSKNPARALALSRLREVDLSVVHLVRDPRAVAWSYAKRFKRDPQAGIEHDQAGIQPWRSAIRWDIALAQAEWVRRRTRLPSLVVRYEDLVADPGATIDRIGRIAGLDLSSAAAAAARGDRFPVGHVVSGNRIRMQRGVDLNRQEAWRERMRRGDQRLVNGLTWPGMLRLRYRPW